MDDKELDALLAGTQKHRPQKRGLPPDIAQARHLETQRRFGAAQSRAHQALARIHPDTYRALYERARIIIDTERGPLPGDD